MRQQGRPEDAVASYRKALSLSPDLAMVHNNLGATLKALGRLGEAIPCFLKAIELRPTLAEAHCNLGTVLQDQGKLTEAVQCYRTALASEPDLLPANNNLGTALLALGRPDEAVPYLRKTLQHEPNLAETHSNLGFALKELGELEEAAACCRAAIALKPEMAEAHNNLGLILQVQGNLEDAIRCYLSAFRLQPNLAEAHVNLGVVLQEQRFLDDAALCFRRAIALRPTSCNAHFNLAMTLLAQGELAEGWKEYEWRWQTSQLVKSHREFPQPQWHGETGGQRTLLIHAEQGFGDTLQFCRYVPLAAARDLQVILEVQKPLVRLLRSLPGAPTVFADGEPLPPFDLHCPMLSLPLAFGTTLESIPNNTPYLFPDAAQAADMHRRLTDRGGQGLRVGLVWAGNPRAHSPGLAAIDRRRSMPAEHLAPLFQIPGAQLVSLQKTGPAAPETFQLVDMMDEMTDFGDTAALIANLDLVISVDTAVAHLAAAIGKPVWLLDRFDACWRWFTGRRDSPWYPNLRLYRQPNPGDWRSVVAAAANDLRALVNAGDRPRDAMPAATRHVTVPEYS